MDDLDLFSFGTLAALILVCTPVSGTTVAFPADATYRVPARQNLFHGSPSQLAILPDRPQVQNGRGRQLRNPGKK